MRFNRSIFSLILFCGLLLLNPLASAQGVSLEEGKVRLIDAIMKNSAWPNEEQIDHFIIGTYGRDPDMSRALRHMVPDMKVRDKRVKMQSFDSLFEARSAHVLIVAQNKNDSLADINRLLNQSQTLIVTEDHDDKRNVMINFTHPSATRLSFEINRSNIVYAGLQLSKQILLFGGTELDVATLYKQTEAELAQAVVTAKEQRAELADQEKQLAKQSKAIASKETELKGLEQGLGKIKDALDKSEAWLKKNENLLAKKESVLAEKEADIDRYSGQIQHNLKLLTDQQDELKEQERLIEEKNTILSKQGSTIKSQQFILVAGGGVLILVTSLIAIIFRSYRAKEAANKQLENKTQALQKTMGDLHMAQQELLSTKALVARHLTSIASFVSDLDFGESYTPLKLDGKTGEKSTDNELDSIVKGINDTSKALVLDHNKLKHTESELRLHKMRLEALVKEVNELNAGLENKVKQRTSELENANDQLVQLTEAKSLFLSTMSHEIRTPLNGVIGMVELLKDTPISPQQRRYLDTIHTSGEVLLSVINDILDFSKIEAGKMAIEKVDYNLEKMIYGCANIFALRSTVNLAFVVDIPHDMPLLLTGDPTRIRQVLLNLLSNAFKFTESGEVRLIAAEVITDGGERQFRISVSDTGTGLTDEHCANIFSAFTQADTSTTRRYGGTGLGLAISQRLAKLMAGDLTVESELGLGSTFTLTLPLEPGEHTGTRINEQLNNHNIIIADPASDQLSLVAHAKAWGMNVKVTQGLDDLHDAIKQSKPELVILPEHIDKQPGLALSKEIAEQAGTAPVLLFSNAAAPIPAEQQKKSSIAGILELPIAPSLFRDSLIQHLHGEQTVKSDADQHQKKEKAQYDNLSVLVAEDNPVNQMVIKGLLARLGITPAIANNGLEAVSQYQENTNGHDGGFDLILMDCEMPELDGLSATRKIRELETTQGHKHTTIVALTAHAMDEHRKRALGAGMDGHLAKPLKPEELEDLLAQLG